MLVTLDMLLAMMMKWARTCCIEPVIQDVFAVGMKYVPLCYCTSLVCMDM